MLSAEESAELRMLQTQAYGPGGSVSAAERDRLQELERRHRPAVAQPVWEPAPDQPAPDLIDASAVPGPAPDSEEAEPDPDADFDLDSLSDADPDPAPVRHRRRWPLLAVASVVILGIGLGIGWGIWGWNSARFALASAHSEERAELEASGGYDPGTVVPVTERHGVVVWRADRSDGEQICVIVTGGEETQNGCVSHEQLADSVWPSANTTVPKGDEKAGQQLVAGLIPTTEGDLAPFIQVWDSQESGWRSQYDEEELAQLSALEAAGYDGSMVSILGYDGDRAVWGSWQNGGLCLIANSDAGFLEGCVDDTVSDLRFGTPVDGVQTEYLVRQSTNRGPQLTITRYPDITVKTVDPETGDPIEFTFDDPTSDGPPSDGETGETPG